MKRSFIPFILLLFSLSLIFSCGSLRKKTESEKAKKTGNIAGIVLDVITEETLAGAAVYIEGLQTIGTKTDTLGRFWLYSIPIGEYSVQASHIGFYTGRIPDVKVYDDSTSIVLFNLVTMAIPERPHWYSWQEKKVKCDSTEFYSTYYKTLLRKKKTGNVAGIVFDKQTMQPLSGANVYVEGMTTIGTKSDTLGRFWLSQVPVGDYKLVGSQITFHATKISGVKISPDSISLVLIGLCSAAIPEHMWCWGDWDGRIIKSDSVSFFEKHYENLLKNK